MRSIDSVRNIEFKCLNNDEYSFIYPLKIIDEDDITLEDVLNYAKEKITPKDNLFIFKGINEYECTSNQYLKKPLSYYAGLDPFIFKYFGSRNNKNYIRIFIKLLTGKTFTIEIPADETIQTLKELIYERVEGSDPPNQQKLTFHGKHLENNKTLQDYNIQNESTLNLVLILKGGNLVQNPKFCDVTNPGIVKEIPFSSNAPKWRVCDYGLNILGICKNESCEAYNQQVICPLREGIFNIIDNQDLLKCPICGNIFDAETCGFNNCTYSFKGIKLDSQGNEIKIPPNKKEVSGESLTYYDPKTGGMAEWKRLSIVIKINEM